MGNIFLFILLMIGSSGVFASEAETMIAGIFDKRVKNLIKPVEAASKRNWNALIRKTEEWPSRKAVQIFKEFDPKMEGEFRYSVTHRPQYADIALEKMFYKDGKLKFGDRVLLFRNGSVKWFKNMIYWPPVGGVSRVKRMRTYEPGLSGTAEIAAQTVFRSTVGMIRIVWNRIKK